MVFNLISISLFPEIGISSLPLAYILAVTGFLLVFLLEKVIFLEHSHDGGHEHSHLPMLPQEEPSNVYHFTIHF